MAGCTALGQPAQVKAVEAAHEAGIEPLWLDDNVALDDAQIVLEEGYFHDSGKVHYTFYYRLNKGAAGSLRIQTYSNASDDWKDYLAPSRDHPSLVIEPARVGEWTGELWVTGTPRRPVNTVRYVLHVDGMVVIATAKSASTGVPGADVNPLIDAELWAQVLEEHLQPYPD